MAIERSANLSDEVTEGQRSVRTEEERVERGRWMKKKKRSRMATVTTPHTLGYI